MARIPEPDKLGVRTQSKTGTAEACYTTRRLRVWTTPYKGRATEYHIKDGANLLLTHRVFVPVRKRKTADGWIVEKKEMAHVVYPYGGWVSAKYVEVHHEETVESILRKLKRRKRKKKNIDDKAGCWRGLTIRKGKPGAGKLIHKVNGIRVDQNSFATICKMIAQLPTDKAIKVEFAAPKKTRNKNSPKKKRKYGMTPAQLKRLKSGGNSQAGKFSARGTSAFGKNELFGAIKPSEWDTSEHCDSVSHRDYAYMPGAFKTIMMACNPAALDRHLDGMLQRGELNAANYNLTQQCRALASRTKTLKGTAGSAGGLTEVVFSFDCTGSMYPFFECVTNNISDCCQTIFKEVPNVRIALIAHGDYCTSSTNDVPYLIETLGFTSNPGDVACFMQNVKCSGAQANMDAEECYELALRRMKELKWTPGSFRMGVLVGDCTPHSPKYTYYRCTTDPKKGGQSTLTDAQCFAQRKELPKWQFANWDQDSIVDKYYVEKGEPTPAWEPMGKYGRQYTNGEPECKIQAFCPGIDYREELAHLARMKVHVHTIKCGESDGSKEFYETVAGSTSGMNLRLGDDRSMGYGWKEIVKECKAQKATSSALMGHTISSATAKKLARDSQDASNLAGATSPSPKLPARHGIHSSFLPKNVVDLILEYVNCIRLE